LVGVGLFIRLAVVEPPVFTRLKESGAGARLPILDVLRSHPRNVVLAMGARIAENGAFYLYTVFVLTYATQPRIGFTSSLVLKAISIAAAVHVFAIPAFGA